MFTYVHFAGAIGGTPAVCARLPVAPAVYAWFRQVTISPASDPLTFAQALHQVVEAPAAPVHRARLGPLHSITMESASRLSRTKSIHLEQMATNATFRRYVSQIIQRASMLQPPLYVGKARNLQQRTEQHLQPMSELATRLRTAGIELAHCTLAYTIVDDTEIDADDSMLTFTEELLTHICRPGFVIRPG